MVKDSGCERLGADADEQEGCVESLSCRVVPHFRLCLHLVSGAGGIMDVVCS